jgi:L-ascorbate metabolism protein UlaG (beta-lactamase superfamily)
MRLIKYSHSCVRFEDGDRVLVIDPGSFSEAEAALAGADAVLITHEHPDHLDLAAVRTAAAANPGLPSWGPASVQSMLADLGERVTAVAGGALFEAAGFAIGTVGGQHALIHPSIPVVANVGYIVEGTVYHPGDSLIVPDVPVQTLLVPTHAPWGRTSEVVDFMISVRAPQAFQIHDGLINERGTALIEGLINRTTTPYGIAFEHLAPTATVTL